MRYTKANKMIKRELSRKVNIRRNSRFLVLCMISLLTLTAACDFSNESEADKLRKENEELKAEKANQETAELRKELNELKNEKEDESDSKTDSKSETKTTSKAAPKPAKTLPITKNEVNDLIDKWENSQNTGDWNEYKSLYSRQFTGIKRTSSGKVRRMNYGQWINDRQKMWKNIDSVSLSSVNITIVGNTATAEFTQDFKSVNYQDTGQKVLKINNFSDGTKIVYEEMKDSN